VLLGRAAGSLHCGKVELVVDWGLEPIPGPTACTEPTRLLPAARWLCLSPLSEFVSFETSAVPSLATAPCTAAKRSQDSPTFLIHCSNSCTRGRCRVTGGLQKHLPLACLPLMMSRSSASHFFWMKRFLSLCLKAGLF